MRAQILCTALMAFSMIAAADKIYKTVDEYGNVTYSDAPTDENSSQVELSPINTAPAIELPTPSPQPLATTEPQQKTAPEAAADKSTQPPDTTPEPAPAVASGYGLRIVSPKPDHRFGPADHNMTVVLITQRKLEQNHYFQVYVDGQAREDKTRANNVSIPLNKALQGRRSLSAGVVNESGELLDSSAPITIFVIRP